MNEEIDAILEQNKRQRKRAIVVFVVVACILGVIAITLAVIASNSDEHKCHERGGAMRCTTATGITAAPQGATPVFVTTCECTR